LDGSLDLSYVDHISTGPTINRDRQSREPDEKGDPMILSLTNLTSHADLPAAPSAPA